MAKLLLRQIVEDRKKKMDKRLGLGDQRWLPGLKPEIPDKYRQLDMIARGLLVRKLPPRKPRLPPDER